MSDIVEYALEHNIKPHFKGDDFAGVTFQLKDGSGNAIDLTGIELTGAWIKNSRDGEVYKPIAVDDGITVDFPNKTFHVDGFNLSNLNCSKLVYWVRAKKNNIKKTRAYGEMIIK